MRILLDNPDSVANLNRLAEIKGEESQFAPAIEIMIADVFNRNRLKVDFDWSESLIKRVGRSDYLSGSYQTATAQQRELSEIVRCTILRPRKEPEHEPKWTHHVLKMVSK